MFAYYLLLQHFIPSPMKNVSFSVWFLFALIHLYMSWKLPTFCGIIHWSWCAIFSLYLKFLRLLSADQRNFVLWGFFSNLVQLWIQRRKRRLHWGLGSGRDTLLSCVWWPPKQQDLKALRWTEMRPWPLQNRLLFRKMEENEMAEFLRGKTQCLWHRKDTSFVMLRWLASPLSSSWTHNCSRSEREKWSCASCSATNETGFCVKSCNFVNAITQIWTASCPQNGIKMVRNPIKKWLLCPPKSPVGLTENANYNWNRKTLSELFNEPKKKTEKKLSFFWAALMLLHTIKELHLWLLVFIQLLVYKPRWLADFSFCGC